MPALHGAALKRLSENRVVLEITIRLAGGPG